MIEKEFEIIIRWLGGIKVITISSAGKLTNKNEAGSSMGNFAPLLMVAGTQPYSDP